MIQHKLAEMAIRIFAAESMAYRVEGLISEHLEGFSWNEPEAAKRMMKAVEEFAAECSMVKVYGSEMLDYVVDEGVQIHGGYGFHQDYAVERAYRDSRINRIFEGTNEINRLLVTGMLLKRAQQGRLGLVKAAKSLMDEILAGPTLASGSESEERKLGRNAKKIALLLLGSAFEKFGPAMEEQQEVLAGIADVVMEILAMESSLLRAEKTSAGADMAAVILRDGMTRIESFAKPVLAACGQGDVLRSKMTVLRRFAKYDPVDSIVIRRRIAERLLSVGHYVVV
jgi:butyryl-CoA dehydrogenase